MMIGGVSFAFTFTLYRSMTPTGSKIYSKNSCPQDGLWKITATLQEAYPSLPALVCIARISTYNSIQMYLFDVSQGVWDPVHKWSYSKPLIPYFEFLVGDEEVNKDEYAADNRWISSILDPWFGLRVYCLGLPCWAETLRFSSFGFSTSLELFLMLDSWNIHWRDRLFWLKPRRRACFFLLPELLLFQ